MGSIPILHGQSINKSALWVNYSITSDAFSINVPVDGELRGRRRIGASLGVEIRRSLKDDFSLDYGFQIKSFRKSFVFNTKEVFIEDLNLHFPLLMNYNLKLAAKHYLNFKMGFNGILQTYQSAEFSDDNYKVELYRNPGFFPNIKLGFGYKFSQERAFEVNALYNMGFLQRNNEIINHISSGTIVNTATNGSFVELEIQFRLSK